MGGMNAIAGAHDRLDLIEENGHARPFGVLPPSVPGSLMGIWPHPPSPGRHCMSPGRMLSCRLSEGSTSIGQRMSAYIDEETTWLVRTLAENADPSSAAVGHLVERLRRLEEEARLEGASRQTLQKIMSARRVLGDGMDFGGVQAPSPSKPPASAHGFGRGVA